MLLIHNISCKWRFHYLGEKTIHFRTNIEKNSSWVKSYYYTLFKEVEHCAEPGHGVLEGYGSRTWKIFSSWFCDCLAVSWWVSKYPWASGSILVGERIWKHNHSIHFQLYNFMGLWLSFSKVRKQKQAVLEKNRLWFMIWYTDCRNDPNSPASVPITMWPWISPYQKVESSSLLFKPVLVL